MKPVLENVAVMSTLQLDKILSQFPAQARIERRTSSAQSNYVRVLVKNGDVVFSALQVYSNRWHVRAVAGLISVVFK